MHAFAPDKTQDRLSIIWLGDPAVAEPVRPDPLPDGWESPLDVYERTLDRSVLTLNAEPLTYHLRPLGPYERSALAEVAATGAKLNYLAYLTIGSRLIEVTGAHPVAERTIRAARVRDPVTGLLTIPPESPFWDQPGAFPAAALWEATLLYMRHQGELSANGGPDSPGN